MPDDTPTPKYELVIVHHGSHVHKGGQVSGGKDEAREYMRWYARHQFPNTTTRKSGEDAVLVKRGGKVIATVAVELAEPQP